MFVLQLKNLKVLDFVNLFSFKNVFQSNGPHAKEFFPQRSFIFCSYFIFLCHPFGPAPCSPELQRRSAPEPHFSLQSFLFITKLVILRAAEKADTSLKSTAEERGLTDVRRRPCPGSIKEQINQPWRWKLGVGGWRRLVEGLTANPVRCTAAPTKSKFIAGSWKLVFL